MNKELYIEIEKLSKEEIELYELVKMLQTFLKENEKNFKKEESIDALKKIKAYLKLKEKEYHEIESKQKEMYKELYSTCRHEIAIKRSYTDFYKCLICNHTVRLEVPKLSIDTTKDYEAEQKIEQTFQDVIHSDKDLIETINNVVEEMQYDRDIKVYRRSK